MTSQFKTVFSADDRELLNSYAKQLRADQKKIQSLQRMVETSRRMGREGRRANDSITRSIGTAIVKVGMMSKGYQLLAT